MITFTQMKKQVATDVGINYTDPQVDTEIARHINTAKHLFQASSERYWDRLEKYTDIKAGQQYYQIASDMRRVREVKAKNGTMMIPLTEVPSETEWNRMNAIEYSGSYPTHFFVKGMDEVGIFPKPSTDISEGLFVAYSPRQTDLSLDDKEINVDMTQNSTLVTLHDPAQLTFTQFMTQNCWLTTKDNTDGNWYKLHKLIDGSHVQLDNNYLGVSGIEIPAVIGEVPQIPEEYHEALIWYADFRYFSKRKDTDSAAMYRTLFNDALEDFKTVYGTKTTGAVINSSTHTRIPTLTDMFANSTLED